MKTIVISAVNLRKGGTLTILRQCLDYLSSVATQHQWRIIALVHKQALADYPHIEYIEFPDSCKSWFSRLRCEHIEMEKVREQIGEVDLWLSLHDTTPSITAKRRAAYFHNSFPFFPWKLRHLWQNPKVVGFSVLTRWFIYRINIHRNNYIIVQQNWFREAICKMFGLRKEKVIVSLPTTHHAPIPVVSKNNEPYHFVFAAFHDVHKNFECLCEAARLLEKEVGENRFKVTLTIGREDSSYTSWLNKKWGKISSIDFAGFQSKEQLYALYAHSDCLVFPSLVETWGLPISEYAVSGKPMLLADLPYAHETAAGAPAVAFFNPHHPQELKDNMLRLLQGDNSFLHSVEKVPLSPPYSTSWAEVFRILLAE